MEAKMKPQKQMMFLSKATPEECIERAQVAIINENGWFLIGPAPYRAYVNTPQPSVKCAIVDIRPVRMDDDESLFAVVDRNVDKTVGVIDMAGLLRGLEGLGAVVTPARSQRVASRGRGDRMRVN